MFTQITHTTPASLHSYRSVLKSYIYSEDESTKLIFISSWDIFSIFFFFSFLTAEHRRWWRPQGTHLSTSTHPPPVLHPLRLLPSSGCHSTAFIHTRKLPCISGLLLLSSEARFYRYLAVERHFYQTFCWYLTSVMTVGKYRCSFLWAFVNV